MSKSLIGTTRNLAVGTMRVFAIAVAASVITGVSSLAGVLTGAVLLLACVIAWAKPMPRLWLGSRLMTTMVFMCVALPVSVIALSDFSAETKERLVAEAAQRDIQLATLKADNPEAYLAALQEEDEGRWMAELKVMRPAQYDAEVARREDVKRRKIAQEKAFAEAERKKACSAKKEAEAFVMSQTYVKRQLKAPSTAKFPSWPSDYQSQAMGDCIYQVVAYVDAQNGFGAMLRSNYVAKMVYLPDSGGWRALDVQIF